MYEYAATLIQLGVHDGDTVHLAVDLGCDITLKMDVRVSHINAPELSTPAGKAARDWAVQWFAAHPRLIIRTVKDKKEKYGRYLAEIFPEIPALPVDLAGSFNQAMLDAGQAVPYEGGAR